MSLEDDKATLIIGLDIACDYSEFLFNELIPKLPAGFFDKKEKQAQPGPCDAATNLCIKLRKINYACKQHKEKLSTSVTMDLDHSDLMGSIHNLICLADDITSRYLEGIENKEISNLDELTRSKLVFLSRQYGQQSGLIMGVVTKKAFSKNRNTLMSSHVKLNKPANTVDAVEPECKCRIG